MSTYLNHDENQFVASAVLYAEKNLIPYADYPYFHMPYLVFIYGFIFKFFNYLLLSSRMVSVISGLLTLIVVFLTGLRVFSEYGYIRSSLIAMGFSLILLNNPLFIYACGHSWNHSLPVLLNLLAFILCCYGARRTSPKKHIFFAGVLVGLSIGARLSFALTPVPFLIMIFLFPNITTIREKTGLALFFCLGLIFSLVPVILCFMLSPEKFVFGNVVFPALTILYRQGMGYERAMTLCEKFRYLQRDILSDPCNLLIVFTFLFFLIMNIACKNLRIGRVSELIFILTLLPFLLIGSFAPTPSFSQYYFAPIPFLVIGILYGLKIAIDNRGKHRTLFIFFSLCVILSGIYGRFNVMSVKYWLQKAFSPGSWETVKIHRIGQEIGSIVKHGKVLTLAPIFPLEGKTEIYREFATGPFAWRVAHFLGKDKRAKYQMISEKDLIEFLEKEPPGALLVGYEKEEGEMVCYARQKGYKEVKLSHGTTLWVRAGDR